MTTYWDMDGVLANFHKAYADDKTTALNRNAMANLEPFSANIATIKSLIAAHEMVYILTKAANEEGKQGKLDWLAKYIPELPVENFICIIGKGKKVDFIREAGTLIDDDEKNTKQWIAAGYEAITLMAKGEVVTL